MTPELAQAFPLEGIPLWLKGSGDCVRQGTCSMTTDDLPLLATQNPGIGEHEDAAPVLVSNRCELPYCRVNQSDAFEWAHKNCLPLELSAVECAHRSGQPLGLPNEDASGTREKKFVVKDFFARGPILGYPRIHPGALELRQFGEGSECMLPLVKFPSGL